MNRPDMKEVSAKESRILNYMKNNEYEAAVIARSDNFSWLTGGGDNRVTLSSENGVCLTIITRDARYIVANTMDGQRIIDEEIAGMKDYQLLSAIWYEQSTEELTRKLLKGKKSFSDVYISGIDYKPNIFYDLHYPLTENEIMKYKILGQKAEEIVRRVADRIKPGMSENNVKTMLEQEYAREEIEGIVYILGSDERIAKYRHCVASDKKIEKLVMLAPACRKWGLTLPITRMVFFGDSLPDELKRKYDALCLIEASTLANCNPGTRFADILEIQKMLFSETGFPDEWKNHFQGGITGYMVNDSGKCLNQDAVISDRQTFNWYITITGAKVEETFLTTQKEKAILSSTGLWPVKRYEVNGNPFDLPQIYLR